MKPFCISYIFRVVYEDFKLSQKLALLSRIQNTNPKPQARVPVHYAALGAVLGAERQLQLLLKLLRSVQILHATGGWGENIHSVAVVGKFSVLVYHQRSPPFPAQTLLILVERNEFRIIHSLY